MQDSNKHLSLQPGHNLLSRFHNRIQFSSHHDGEALVLGKREFDMCPGLLHDIQAHFRLLTFTKLTVVFIPPLLQRNMEHLKVQREVEKCGRRSLTLKRYSAAYSDCTNLLWMIIYVTWVMTEALMGRILLQAPAGSPVFSPGVPLSGKGGKASR